MMAKKVLYISYDGMTDPLGQSQVLPYLTGLSRNGYDISIVSAEKPGAFEKHATLIRSTCEENNLHWFPVKYHKSPPVLSTLYDLWTMYRLSIKLILGEKISLIHCRSYLPAMLARRLKKKIGTKWIFDMRGFWIDERVEGGIWNLKNPVFRMIYSYLKKEELKLIRQSDHIVSLTKKAIPVINRMKEGATDITVIPCCVDTDHFNPSGFRNEIKHSERIKSGIPPGAYVLGYLGSYSTWYMPSEMLDFFKALKEQEPESYFLIITHENKAKFEELAREKGIDPSCLIFKSATRSEMPNLLSMLDSAVFFILPAFSKQASSPVKLGEFLSMGIPVLTNQGVGDMDEILSNPELGILIKDFRTQTLSESVKKLLGFRSHDLSGKIRETAKELFSLEYGIRQYQAVYNRFFQVSHGDKTHS
jgi:glycosyltransferase involved in cell wall biosynthesis